MKSVEADSEIPVSGAFAILPSSVNTAISLGGYIGLFEKNEERSTMTIGDCKWSVAGRKGKKSRTKEEAGRSE